MNEKDQKKREYQVSRADDTVAIQTVGIKDIDEAIFFYFTIKHLIKI